MSFLSAMNISASGLTAQKYRMDVISENISNADTNITESGNLSRRKMAVLEAYGDSFGVQLLLYTKSVSWGHSGDTSE